MRTLVTRRRGEELNPTSVVQRITRKAEWMFWGSISGRTVKGPGVFWCKDWGTIGTVL
jgi:hypothetical protein